MSFRDWLLAGDVSDKHSASSDPAQAWWRVMCLTGVDYFSTLGYQPGIAFLAAGALSPLATLVLVAATLFGALPVYGRVAEASPNGQGSIAMLETLFPRWTGKLFVLILLGFATTDFVITMTLSAADAAAHVTHNPLAPAWLQSQMRVTLAILAILGIVFLKGFKEAIQIAVVLVSVYLALNAIVATVALFHLAEHAHLFVDWRRVLYTQHRDVLAMIGVSLVLFPKLALGLSGFETGVTVMPLIQGTDIQARIANTRKLLRTAAMIMSVFLMLTSITSTLLIPPTAFQAGGPANGRAIAYLAHLYLGDAFGTVYDMSTILILGFAGASAMAGLLNLIPRYLPRYGMAPEWARAFRPLVFVFLLVAFAVTRLFSADVDAQGGAYATGVLVLMTSAAIAVSMSRWKSARRWPYLLIAVIFVYTTLLNIYERPEGIKISIFFILAMMFTSFLSRAMRSTELRITSIRWDDAARDLLKDDNDRIFHVVAHSPQSKFRADLDTADRDVRSNHYIDPNECLYFFEVLPGDASDFEQSLLVTGRRVGPHRVLSARSPVIANAFAALLIDLGKQTGKVPHAYFGWTEGNPITNFVEFLFLGVGDTAPVTHEVLRRAVEDPRRRPVIHVS
jgi:hypothetical protein